MKWSKPCIDHTNCYSSTLFRKVAAGIIGDSPSQQVTHSGGVAATQDTSSSSHQGTVTSTIDNIINHELAEERENYTIKD